MMNNIGLYVHVPFCLSKCPYCDFYSVKYSRSLAADYTKAVIRNLGQYGETFDTVYFGGGTPVIMWEGVCEILKSAKTAENAEITIESNPCVTTKQALCGLREAGVNRISFGVQSLSPSELVFLGRRHSAEQAEKAVLLAHKAGFTNISADIMLGLVGQTKESLKYTIDGLSELPITHVSAYMLKIEEGTPFAARKLSLPDEETVSELYLYAVSLLEEKGFMQYEISNFARKGYECRHNLKYWRCEEYLGIGAAAHSYYGGKRFCTERDIEGFIGSEFQKTKVTDDNPGGFEEYAMLRLRLSEGLSFSDCESFGVSREEVLKRCRKIPDSLILQTEKGISLTPQGFLVSNAVIGKILGY
ncbi:MAG: radical SAM family heme chaperone HemW [Ruminiclostridium sp.]